MKFFRKREIILERERTITVKLNNASSRTLCELCETPVYLLAIDEAAAASELSSREIFRLVEDGRIHFEETTGGKLLVCLASLAGLGDDETLAAGKKRSQRILKR